MVNNFSKNETSNVLLKQQIVKKCLKLHNPRIRANCTKSLLKREMADVLLLEQCHGLLVTVIKESPKSSDPQKILFTQSICFIYLQLDVLGALQAQVSSWRAFLA